MTNRKRFNVDVSLDENGVVDEYNHDGNEVRVGDGG